jgi:hypothetical protein
MAMIDGFCASSDNTTVISTPHPNQVEINVAQKIKDNMAGNQEDCSDADCSPTVVENCKALWEAKFQKCIEKAEEWAYQCPAPTYDGHNCKHGCCSEVAQDDCAAMEMPPMEEVWKFMSGDGDVVTRPGLEGGLVALLPPTVGDHVAAVADCMMLAYDVDGTGEIDETEFAEGYGKHLPTCLEENVPPEVLAEMTKCGDDLQEFWDFLSSADDGDKSSATVADVAAALGAEVPPLAGHAVPVAECIVGLVDSDKDGKVQFEEFETSAKNEVDVMGPCMQHVPEDVLAAMGAHQGDEDGHWCDYTDPEEEPCCKKSSHEEQDACMNEKMKDGHWCDWTDPEEEPCCKKSSHEEQDKCMNEKMKDAHYCDHVGPDDEPCCAKQDRKEQDGCLKKKGILDEKKEDGHWCDYTDPEEEPCCKKSSHGEQDKCMNEKKKDGHYCDHVGPDDEPCCAKQDRKEQDGCLKKKGILWQTQRKPHLRINKVQAAFSRFMHLTGRLETKMVGSLKTQFILKRFIRTKRSSKKASKDAKLPSSKKTNVKTLKGSKAIKLNPKLSNKLSSNPMKLKPTAHTK